MIAIVHSIYSQSVHTLALDAGLMDNDAERYCICISWIEYIHVQLHMTRQFTSNSLSEVPIFARQTQLTRK